MRDYLDDLKADFNADSDRALSTNKLFLAKLDRLQAALDGRYSSASAEPLSSQCISSQESMPPARS